MELTLAGVTALATAGLEVALVAAGLEVALVAMAAAVFADVVGAGGLSPAP